MAKGTGNRSWQKALIVLTGTVLTVVLIAGLYWAQAILMPVALAVFLSFLLGPLVAFLQRHGVGRVPAVLGAMLLAVVVLGGTIWLVTSQVTALLTRLPRYSENIQSKVKVVTDRLDVLNRSLGKVMGVPEDEAGAAAAETAVAGKGESRWVTWATAALGPLAHGLGSAGLALVLTGFMLLKREDLRNRLIRLAGEGQITTATRALDEAAQRISRFLLTQVLINAAAGASIGLGLLVLRVDYALLWGFLIFILRYVPYLGIWFAALPPILLSFAQYQGWTVPLLAVALIFVVEMVCGNVLEPWLFGRSIGVSEVSLLVAAAFWAFLWGPIGMVLSSPLTVCLVVLGKYHPRLKFLDVLLGDEPALEPDVTFYQRLLARDQDEAEDIVQEQLAEAPPEKVLDELVVSALVYAKRDRARDELSEEDEGFILSATREIGEDLAERLELPPPVPTGSISGVTEDSLPPRAYVLACPAHDHEDEVALQLLAATLDPTRWNVEVLSPDTLSSELLLTTDEKRPDLICIAALPPSGLAHTRYLCKRLRSRFPEVKIIVARWGLQSSGEENAQRLRDAGADIITTTLVETRTQLQAWRPVLAQEEKVPPPPRKPEGVSV